MEVQKLVVERTKLEVGLVVSSSTATSTTLPQTFSLCV